MPKLYGTRKQRARELLERIKRGPGFNVPMDGSSLTVEQVKDLYQLWVGSWVLEDLQDLIPELRKDAEKKR
jgi:hypothetical protein